MAVAVRHRERRKALLEQVALEEGRLARLDTLFLAMPVSWKGTLIQYSGRLHRLRPDKEEVRIFDYVDREVPLLMRMFEKRLRTYGAIGYVGGGASVGYGEPVDEPTVEYDEEAIRYFEDGEPRQAAGSVPGRSSVRRSQRRYISTRARSEAR